MGWKRSRERDRSTVKGSCCHFPMQLAEFGLMVDVRWSTASSDGLIGEWLLFSVSGDVQSASVWLEGGDSPGSYCVGADGSPRLLEVEVEEREREWPEQICYWPGDAPG